MKNGKQKARNLKRPIVADDNQFTHQLQINSCSKAKFGHLRFGAE